MKRHLGFAHLLAPVLLATGVQAEASWIFRPGTYSHDPATGARVVQYERPAPAYFREDPTYMQSGYRQTESALRVGNSGDYRHIVETWGEGEFIRPYGEWLYPYRAGATPFGPWGNPQGPWTLPFDSWVNPYGSWNRFGYPYPPAMPDYGGPYYPDAPGYGAGPYPPTDFGGGAAPPAAQSHQPPQAHGSRYPGGYRGDPRAYRGGD
jgi:hypothetical protein